jgi:hypothetical protein
LPQANELNVKAYRILAKHLSDEWDTSRKKPTNRPDLAQIVAEANNIILDLDGLKIHDPDLEMVRRDAKEATQDAISALRKLNELPPPPGAGELFLNGFLFGISGRFDLAGEAGDRAQKQLDAILAQFRKLSSACEQISAAKLLLKRTAKKYSGKSNLPNLEVDVDEGFLLEPQDDWIALTNTTGCDLQNALLRVHLTGLKGDTKENIHFFPKWQKEKTIYAAYPGGIKIQDLIIGRQTVTLIQSVRMEVWADEGHIPEFKYEYAGDEKTKDVEREFDVIRAKVTWSVRDGFLGDRKVFTLYNKTGRVLPKVAIRTPAGTRNHDLFLADDYLEVGKLQVSRNLNPGERVTVSICGYELNSFTIPK